MEHTISCPKVGLVLMRHGGNAKEWVYLGANVLTPIPVSYETQIHSMTVKG